MSVLRVASPASLWGGATSQDHQPRPQPSGPDPASPPSPRGSRELLLPNAPGTASISGEPPPSNRGGGAEAGGPGGSPPRPGAPRTGKALPPPGREATSPSRCPGPEPGSSPWLPALPPPPHDSGGATPPLALRPGTAGGWACGRALRLDAAPSGGRCRQEAALIGWRLQGAVSWRRPSGQGTHPQVWKREKLPCLCASAGLFGSVRAVPARLRSYSHRSWEHSVRRGEMPDWWAGVSRVPGSAEPGHPQDGRHRSGALCPPLWAPGTRETPNTHPHGEGAP